MSAAEVTHARGPSAQYGADFSFSRRENERPSHIRLAYVETSEWGPEHEMLPHFVQINGQPGTVIYNQHPIVTLARLLWLSTPENHRVEVSLKNGRKEPLRLAMYRAEEGHCVELEGAPVHPAYSSEDDAVFSFACMLLNGTILESYVAPLS